MRELYSRVATRTPARVVAVPPNLNVIGIRKTFRLLRYFIFFLSPARTYRFFEFLLTRKSKENRYIFTWTEDFQWISRVPKDRTFHLVQSDDIWGSSAELVYECNNAPIRRIPVADHLLQARHGQAFPTLDLTELIDKEPSNVPKENIITTFLADAWFKGAQSNDYFAKQIADAIDFRFISFGRKKSKIADESLSFLTKEELLDLFSRARLFVSLSHHEGMPLLVLEAIYKNVFCILSDIPAHREIAEIFPGRVHIVQRHKSIADAANSIKAFIEQFQADVDVEVRPISERDSTITFDDAAQLIIGNRE